jgi:mannosyltransferase
VGLREFQAGGRFRLHPRLLLIAVLVLSLGLRIYQINDSMWVDELHTAWVAAGPAEDIVARAAEGNQTPLFFAVEWLLWRLLGPSEFSLRLPSLIAGVGLSWVCYELVQKLQRAENDSFAPLLAACLVAVDPQAIFYAQEARPYAFLQLVSALLALVTWLRLEGDSSRLRLAWITAAATCVHLHLSAGLVVAGLTLVLLLKAGIGKSSEQEPRLRDVCLDIFIALVLISPLIPLARMVSMRQENWGKFINEHPGWHDWLTVFRWSPAILVLLGLKVLQTVLLHRRGEEFLRQVVAPILRSPAFILLSAWQLFPAATAWLATRCADSPLFYPRYLLGSWPATIIAAACCSLLIPLKWVRFAIAGALVVWVIWHAGYFEQWKATGRLLADRREDWRSAAQRLNSEWREQPLPVLVFTRWIECDSLSECSPNRGDRLRLYCLAPANSLYPLAAPDSDIYPLRFTHPGRLDATVATVVSQRGGAWVYGRGRESLLEELKTDLKASFSSTNQPQVELEQSFGQVHLLRVRFLAKE